MNQIAFLAAATWLAAGLVGTGSASAAGPEAPKHKAHIQGKLAAKLAKPPRVSEEAARRIAWGSGVDHIEEIVLSGELWEVAGHDRFGNEKALDIHAYDGRVLD
jgi:hypothetical protein